jgi:phosphatidylethanolamine-binding protein (PEBP) family uncharacterized protein
MYYTKYNKYKTKYLQLKNQIGNGNVSFVINETIIDNDKIYKTENFQGEYVINFDYNENKLYTIIMIDENAVNTTDGNYYIHLLKINTINEVIKFIPPTPPKDTGIHNYHIKIYEQPMYLKINNVPPRENFNLNYFVEQYNLKEVGNFTYKVAYNT